VPKGGIREGAGRKPGSTNRRHRLVADKLAQGGILPLEVMILNMRRLYAAKKFDEAQAVAKDAAPYMHPRLAATEHTGQDGGPIEQTWTVNFVKPDATG
jgi:hypothetical protein